MSGARVVIDYDFAPLERAFRGLQELGQDPHEMLGLMGESLISSTQRRFETSTDKDGNPWKPSKRVLKKGGKTLVIKGWEGLKGSISYNILPDSVEWGSHLVYAAIHQFGGHAGRGAVVPIPQRAFLGVNDEDLDELEAIGYDFLADAAGALA